MTDASFSCRVCGNAEGNTTHTFHEMMFGTREPFEYVECSACGCLQIREIPPNLPDYYPPNYPSYGAPKIVGPVKAFFRTQWAKHHLEKPSLLGALLTAVYGEAEFFDWAKRTGLSLDASILDVGAARGVRLAQMYTCGFRNVLGVDPFVEGDLIYADGLRVLKRDIHEVDGQYDLVMSNHSLEHVPDPHDFLKEIHRLVKPGHYALIRTPVASSWAREHYGDDWFALEAPRHLYIHTHKSMEVLANGAGFGLEDVVGDSTGFTLWASEQYRKGIPLVDERSYYVNPKQSIFSAQDIRAFQRKAHDLNEAGLGDTAAFFLRKR